MGYLLSRLKTNFPTKESTQLLCYYINDTNNMQIIRMLSGVKCEFERIVFPGERILFKALPESYLEVYSPLINEIQSTRMSCRFLQINENPDLTKYPKEREFNHLQFS